MGRVLTQIEALDRRLQSGASHPLLGTASLHASLIEGGRELSSYPDRCVLQMERRTLPAEPIGCASREVEAILDRLRASDPEFRASARSAFARSPYEIAADHPLPRLMVEVLARAQGPPAAPSASSAAPESSSVSSLCGMSFWTDAAILGAAGIPSVLFGPTGAGLHGLEEWVDVASVLTCRDALVELIRQWCR
jgi:acetylornithine deacetylase